jgi:hypothetical protein
VCLDSQQIGFLYYNWQDIAGEQGWCYSCKVSDKNFTDGHEGVIIGN